MREKMLRCLDDVGRVGLEYVCLASLLKSVGEYLEHRQLDLVLIYDSLGL